MYKLGIADALLGENRTILLCDENTKIEKLAFDINHKRVSPINTQNQSFHKELSSWIKLALEEADRDHFSQRYVLEELGADLIVVINYFYRMMYYSNPTYTDGFNVLSREEFILELKKTHIGMYTAKVNFKGVIISLEEKVKKLYSFTNKRVMWQIMNIISSLKDYQMYCQSIQYRHLQVLEEKEQYGLYDKKTFFLKGSVGIEGLRGNAFFNEDIVICQNETCNIVLDKRILTNDDDNFKVQNVSIPNAGMQTAVVMRTAIYVDGYIEHLAEYAINVLKACMDFCNYCGFELQHLGKDGSATGIISLLLK